MGPRAGQSHSRFKQVVVAFGTAALLTAAAASAVLAQWPTTCVELNDIVEAHLGNENNVGIYQRVFGDQAEQACQNDHRDDVRGVFAWAFADYEPPTSQSVPSPTPAAPEPTPQEPAQHPDYAQILDTAISRGASPQLADAIANSVIARGTVDAFLAGFDLGVQYGSVPVRVAGTGAADSNAIRLPRGLYQATISFRDNEGYSGPGLFVMHLCSANVGCRLIMNRISQAGSLNYEFEVLSGDIVTMWVWVQAAHAGAAWEVSFTRTG